MKFEAMNNIKSRCF